MYHSIADRDAKALPVWNVSETFLQMFFALLALPLWHRRLPEGTSSKKEKIFYFALNIPEKR